MVSLRRNPVFYALLLLLLTVGQACDSLASAPSPVPVAAPSTPGQATPSATVQNGKEAIRLIPDEAGYQLEASSGLVRVTAWLNAALLLANWSDASTDTVTASYLIDLTTGLVTPLKTVVSGVAVPQREGHAAIVLQGNFSSPEEVQAALLDVPTASIQPIFALDPGVSQWAGPADRSWQFGAVPGVLSAVWIGPDTVVLTATPQDEHNISNWGKVVLVNIKSHTVQTLTDHGQLAAAMPNGNLLLQDGWVDAGLQLLQPPYDRPPTLVTPAGPWAWGWAVSPDSQKVAWWELQPPAGDWSHRLPHMCCSGDPQPRVEALAIWDQATKQVRRFSVPTVSWARDMRLYWRADSRALFFTGAPPDNPSQIALFQSMFDGQQVLLARYDWSGNIKLEAEGSDGTLYYQVSGRQGQNDSQLIRRAADGTQTILREGVPSDYYVDRGRLISEQGSSLIVQDLVSGESWRLAVPLQGALLSLDGRWAADTGGAPIIRLVRAK